jgi:HK97 family phage prohead protease
MMQDTQKRTVTIPKVTFRAATDTTPATVSGRAIVYNSLSVPIPEYGGLREMIFPGAVTNALIGADIRLLVNHDANLVLGRNTSGTMTLKEDEMGLSFECQLGSQSYAQDLAVTLSRGDMSGCSFAFNIENSTTDKVAGESVVVIRKISDVSDLSVVTYPAYTATTASVRSLIFNEPEKVVTLDPPDELWEVKNRQRQLQLLELE